MTESHNQSNVRRCVAQSIEALRTLLEEIDSAGEFRMGVDTGIDLARYLDACAIAVSIPGGVTGGHVRHIPRERIVSSIGGR